MDLDKVNYWTELSDYDFDTADAMFRTVDGSMLDICVVHKKELQQWVKTML